MIIVKVWGGIGNQLFQYVFGQYLRYRYKQDVCYDDSSYLTTDKLRNSELSALDGNIVFNNECSFSRYRGIKNRLLRFLFQLNPKHHFVAESSRTLPEYFESSHTYFFQGYWQDVKYYQWLKNNVPGFSIRIKEMPEELSFIKEKIQATKDSISIHVRRGDYFTPQNVGIYGVCDASYYERAVELLSQKLNNPEIFVFSDDIDWVKNNIHAKGTFTIVPNYDVAQFAYIELMSYCKHHVISNSSFSWWGAVINEQKDAVVVCPNRWLLNSDKTIALDKWRKI